MIANKFGIFDHIEDIPGTPTSQLFKDRLTLIRMADEAGFAGLSPGRAPRQRPLHGPGSGAVHRGGVPGDEAIRLGPMVKLLPMHHPVRIIEDMCVLDQLTGGRLEFGVGRGAVPIEHYWFSQDWWESRDRFTDVLGIIRARAGVRRDLEREQPLLRLPDDADVDQAVPGADPVLVPRQPRRPRGSHGMSLMWPGKIRPERLRAVPRGMARTRGDDIRFDGPDSEPRVGYSMLLSIAPTEDEARDIARRGIEGLVRRTRNAHRFDHLRLSEQECYDAQGPLRAIHANMEPAIEIGSGTPGQIVERVGALLDDGMVDYICFMFPTGDMTLRGVEADARAADHRGHPAARAVTGEILTPGQRRSHPMKIASGSSALTMYWPASTISEIFRSTARLQST